MIGSLRGTLIDVSPSAGEALIEVCGVGYRVNVSGSTLVSLGSIGDDAFVFVHHHIREDAQTLYGFATRDERVSFEALLGAHGVGPSLAMAILSVHSPLALRKLLAEDDISGLCLVPGVGKKTAARLLIELKSKLDIPELDLTAVGGGSAHGGGAAAPAAAKVRDALAGLGYGIDEIREATRDFEATDESAMLREALQRLGAARHA
ncbi:MAG: Holliday junction branch migration protein RuvA [Acidimicrobiia bacterium]